MYRIKLWVNLKRIQWKNSQKSKVYVVGPLILYKDSMNYSWRGDKITQIKVGLNGTVDMDKYSGRCKYCLI